MTDTDFAGPHPAHFTPEGIHSADDVRDQTEKTISEAFHDMIPAMADMDIALQHEAVHQLTRMAGLFQHSVLQQIYDSLNRTAPVLLLSGRFEEAGAISNILNRLNDMLIELGYLIQHFGEPVPERFQPNIDAIAEMLPRRESYREKSTAVSEAASVGDIESMVSMLMSALGFDPNEAPDYDDVPGRQQQQPTEDLELGPLDTPKDR